MCGETPRLKVVPFRGRPWNLCLNEECPSMEEMRKRRAEREAAKAAKEAAEKADENGKGAAKDGAAAKDGEPDKAALDAAVAKTKVKRARGGNRGGATKRSRSRAKSPKS